MAGFRKAERKKAKLRLGLAGPAGSGKTYTALLVAYGITGNWDEIGLIDTENHSGELYANHGPIGEFQYLCIDSPYTPDKYVTAIKMGQEAGLKVIIVDSLTHAWAGEGGLLDKKGQIEKKTGNGWTAWRDITPMHNRLVESILSSSCHMICTLRSKMEHVQEKNEQGKTVVRKVGMGSIQRDGMEYEFTSFVEMDQDHMATSTKDRTGLLDGKYFKPDIDTGKMLVEWLELGIDAPPVEPIAEPVAEKTQLNVLPYGTAGKQSTTTATASCACGKSIGPGVANYCKQNNIEPPTCMDCRKVTASK